MTIISPCYNNGKVIFYVASRGHHADIGGITPGSMPSFSKSIYDEGIGIKTFKIVKEGVF
jgi:5-oxoprolinase (ATP-hydrolysing)